MVHNERKIQQLKSVTGPVQNKDVSHHFPAAWCKNKTTQPLSKRRDNNSGEFHLEERKQTAGRDQLRSVELITVSVQNITTEQIKVEGIMDSSQIHHVTSLTTQNIIS